MPHIPLPEGVPGPRGPMLFRPEVGPPMSELAEVLMRGPSTLTLAERELIGTYVSARNDCRYCQTIHGAVAAYYLGATVEEEKLVQQIKSDPSTAPISAKLKALLNIAGHVQQGGVLLPLQIGHGQVLAVGGQRLFETPVIAQFVGVVEERARRVVPRCTGSFEDAQVAVALFVGPIGERAVLNPGVGPSHPPIGRQGDDEINAWEWAQRLGTIAYEVTCALSPRLPRIYT